jgi:hypothetical protein
MVNAAKPDAWFGKSMGRFASAAYQLAESNEGLKLEIVAREKAEGELRKLTAGISASRESAALGLARGANDERGDKRG